MGAIVRYAYGRCLLSQRWMPPILLFVLGVGSLYPSGPTSIGSSLASGAIILVPVGAWLAVAAINSEDVSQRGITAVAAGGYRTARAGTILAAASCAALLSLFSLAIALLRDPHVWDPSAFQADGAAETIAFGVLAQLAGAVFGAALGGLVAQPVIRRAGFSWLSVALVVLLGLAVTGSPFRGVVAVLSRRPDAAAGNTDVPDLVVAVSAICLLAAAVLAAGLELARRRE
jgi:hypothetical protein